MDRSETWQMDGFAYLGCADDPRVAMIGGWKVEELDVGWEYSVSRSIPLLAGG